MIKERYKILWIDDEHEKLGQLKTEANQNGIHLVAFKSLNGGFDELEKNYQLYDGVLLDAKFYENEDDVEKSEDLEQLIKARDKLQKLPKKFEIFVLTGQSLLFEDQTFNAFFPKYYKKGVDVDIDRLFEDIKKAADQQKDTQIRHEYQRVFDVCNEKYIGESAARDLLNIFHNKNEWNTDVYLSTIRRFVQDIFEQFNKHKLLPDEFITPHVALNESSKFLSGRTEKGYKLKEESCLPKVVADNLRFILDVTQPGSHRSQVDEHIKEMNAPYLVDGVLNQLLDLIIWFKTYIDSNPKKNNWTKEDIETDREAFIEGEVINMNPEKGFAFLKPHNEGENLFIPPILVQKYQLSEGMYIKAEIEEYTYHKTQETNTRAKNIEIL